MTATYVRTLRAILLDPTAKKRVKLERLEETYRGALRKCLTVGCQSMSETNTVVTPFELPYQVKDALKSYVPTIAGSESDCENSPVRFVNRAARFDRDPNRVHEFVWRVPQPGRGTDFWIPLRINPNDEPVWEDLVHKRVLPGELQLLYKGGNWRLHVAISRPIEWEGHQRAGTPIGIDIGEQSLVTACALDDETPVRPILIDGAESKRLRKELFTTVRRFQRRDVADWRIDERKRTFQNTFTDIIEQTSRSVVDYAETFDDPIIVLEDLDGFRYGLDERKFLNRRLHTWPFGRLQRRIHDKAVEAGIPVQFGSPVHSSTTCHACDVEGTRPDRGTFECTNTSCYVTEFHADINAAANMAKRADLGGETGRVKSDRDDSPQDGSAGDSATVDQQQ